MKNPPVKNQTYEISYDGPADGCFDYNSYRGTGVYSGKTDDFGDDKVYYGFFISESRADGDECYFPLDSIFPAE